MTFALIVSAMVRPFPKAGVSYSLDWAALQPTSSAHAGHHAGHFAKLVCLNVVLVTRTSHIAENTKSLMMEDIYTVYIHAISSFVQLFKIASVWLNVYVRCAALHVI